MSGDCRNTWPWLTELSRDEDRVTLCSVPERCSDELATLGVDVDDGGLAAQPRPESPSP